VAPAGADAEQMSGHVGVPLGLFLGFGLCVAVVALFIAPKRTPDTRAGSKSGRELDRRRRAAWAAIGAGSVVIGGGRELPTIPSHPVWVWVLAGPSQPRNSSRSARPNIHERLVVLQGSEPRGHVRGGLLDLVLGVRDRLEGVRD
jgi:hypothetical protein